MDRLNELLADAQFSPEDIAMKKGLYHFSMESIWDYPEICVIKKPVIQADIYH